VKALVVFGDLAAIANQLAHQSINNDFSTASFGDFRTRDNTFSPTGGCQGADMLDTVLQIIYLGNEDLFFTKLGYSSHSAMFQIPTQPNRG
jgi:hypothetical protein